MATKSVKRLLKRIKSPAKRRASTRVKKPVKREARVKKPVLKVVADNVVPLPKRDPLKISAETVARTKTFGRKNNQAVDRARLQEMLRLSFQRAQPMPGVVPENAPKLAMDDAIASQFDWATSALSAGLWSEGLFFPGYAYLAELAQRPEYRRISEIIAQEMTRKWIKITNKGDEDKTDKIAELVEAVEDFGIQEKFRAIAEQDGQFGRAHLVVDVGDAIERDNRDELKTSIGNGRDKVSKEKIAKGDVRGFRTVEAMWCYPANYTSSNPLRGSWYNPSSWWVSGAEVHGSRLLTFVGREVPDILKSAYCFGGVSMSQLMKPYVDTWLRNRTSVSDLMHSFSSMVLKTDLATMLMGDAAGLFNRTAVFNNMRDNSGLMLLNKDTEDFANVSTPLGTLDSLLAQSQEHMCSIAGIPVVKLLGIQPAGLNSSSQGEIDTFADSIKAYQKKFFAARLRCVLDIIQLHLWGEVDSDITHDFVPLEEMSEKELAEMRKMDAEVDDLHINAGAISALEVRKRIANDANSPYGNLDVEDLPEPPDEILGGGELDPGEAGGGAQPDGPEVNKDVVLPFAADDFKEGDHPRGQPGNAGQFGPGGGGGGSKKEGGKAPAAKSSAPVDGFTAPAPTPEQRRKDIKSVLEKPAKLSYAYRTKVLQALEQAKADGADNKTMSQLLGKMVEYYGLRKADYEKLGDAGKAKLIGNKIEAANREIQKLGGGGETKAPPEVKKPPTPPKPEVKKDPQLDKKAQAILDVTREMAVKMGFNPDRISIAKEEYHFVLNGKACKAAGTAQLRDKTIKMYPNNLLDPTQGEYHARQIKQVAAHEVMHCKFQTVLDNAYRPDTPQLTMKLQALCFGAENLKDLAASDGVTDYSKEYWKGYHEGKINSNSALHETLAEMASKLRNGDKPKHRGSQNKKATNAEEGARFQRGVDKWNQLYDLIEEYYPKLQAHK